MQKFSTNAQQMLLAALILLGVHIVVSFVSFIVKPESYSRVLWTISFLDVSASFILLILACYYGLTTDSDDDETFIASEDSSNEEKSIPLEYQDANGNPVSQ